jgi:hypothetical protein
MNLREQEVHTAKTTRDAVSLDIHGWGKGGRGGFIAQEKNLHSARTRSFSLTKSGKVSLVRDSTSDADATAAAARPSASEVKERILTKWTGLVSKVLVWDGKAKARRKFVSEFRGSCSFCKPSV